MKSRSIAGVAADAAAPADVDPAAVAEADPTAVTDAHPAVGDAVMPGMTAIGLVGMALGVIALAGIGAVASGVVGVAGVVGVLAGVVSGASVDVKSGPVVAAALSKGGSNEVSAAAAGTDSADSGESSGSEGGSASHGTDSVGLDVEAAGKGDAAGVGTMGDTGAADADAVGATGEFGVDVKPGGGAATASGSSINSSGRSGRGASAGGVGRPAYPLGMTDLTSALDAALGTCADTAAVGLGVIASDGAREAAARAAGGFAAPDVPLTRGVPVLALGVDGRVAPTVLAADALTPPLGWPLRETAGVLALGAVASVLTVPSVLMEAALALLGSARGGPDEAWVGEVERAAVPKARLADSPLAGPPAAVRFDVGLLSWAVRVDALPL